MPKLAVTGGNEESGAMVFGNRALTGKPLRVACVKMETESSVLIRPLIATPAQGGSRS